MQDQMKQVQAQLKTRRLHRQRSMPTRLFAPPEPPAPEPKLVSNTPAQSIFDTDAIGFIDSDENNEPMEKSTEISTPTPVAELSEKGEEPVVRSCSLDNLKIPQMNMYLSRGDVTTDEDSSDDDSSDRPTKMAISNHSEIDSGLSTAENATDPDGRSPMNEELADEVTHVINGHLSDDMQAVEISKQTTVDGKMKKIAGNTDDDYLDENEIGEGFDEGLQ